MAAKKDTTRMNRPPLELVPNHISENTVSALTQLLLEAQRGDIVGLAFVALRRGRQYFVDFTGAAYRNPTFARGMVATLDDELRRHVNSDD